jgi:L-fucose isomerase-like protein
LPAAPPAPGRAGPERSAPRPRLDEDAARTALDRLRGQRIGAVGDAPPGFTPSEYDPEVLRRRFGLEVEVIGLDEALERFRAVDPAVRDRERADAVAWQPSVAAHADEVRDASAGVTAGLRTWSAEAGLSALAVRCWPELPVETGVCPCASLSRLADEDVDTQCERDVHGAATMLLLRALGAGPTYLVDTVDLEADRNLVRFWHCGAAATRLAADPAAAAQSVHCNRRIGIVGDFPLRPGRVVASRLTEDPGTDGGLRLLLAAGEAVAAPNRFQGNTADVVLDTDAEAFVQGLVTGGFPHHTVLAWEDVRPGLRAVADLLDIPVTEL